MVEIGKVDEVLSAMDNKNRTAFHLAALNGNADILEWCIAKWNELGREMPLDAPDINGCSPLLLACI